MVNDFIFELGCEELPSGAVWPLADELAKQLILALDKAQLTHGDVKPFATPRRIAVRIKDLQVEQASQQVTRRGPAANAAFDSAGNPTQALLGFAKSCGVEVSQLTRTQTDKGEWMVHESISSGAKTKDILPGLIAQALAALPIAKPMRWGDNDEEFARPVHWAVLLFGNETIQYPFLGVTSDAYSKGHRFHHPESIRIESPDSYEHQLERCFVMPDFAKRRDEITKQVDALAKSLQATPVMPDDLLDEVTSIVEWPQALLANFEKEFLDVPAEALIASMQSHQKCFALKDTQGKLLPHFITVSNIKSSNPQQVILGNEKVMRARLSDADFFFRQDKKSALSTRMASTEHVVFQAKLGTLMDKSKRMMALMSHLGQQLDLPEQDAKRAAELSKCDLMTGMVGEFPELQGLMGYYYALHDGESEAVAIALNEQYMPRFARDKIPTTNLGLALSLADRIDTLVGIFAIGQKPTGVKDPFKLRRHALAVVRMLISTPAHINLSTLISESMVYYSGRLPADQTDMADLIPFIFDRLQSHYQSQGMTVDLVNAVRAKQDSWLYDFDKRLYALKDFVSMPEANSLAAACKRVNNILNQAGVKREHFTLNEALFQEDAERALYAQIQKVKQQIAPLYTAADYGPLLKQLASLKVPVDSFFDHVMVMVDDPAVKNNRLALLAELQDVMQGVADISMLQAI